MPKQQIVYVLSTNYAGSHFLTLMLASHSRCASVGEAHRIRRKTENRLACGLCEDITCCPVFKGVTYKQLPRIYDIIYANLHEKDASINTLIDASKKTSWAKRYLGLTKYDMRFIHLIRDPRALARRWLMKYSPEHFKTIRLKLAKRNLLLAPRILSCDVASLMSYKWLITNQRITNFLSRYKLNHQVCTYQELALNTNTQIESITHWLGHNFEPDQINYWNFPHHGSRKKDYDFKSNEVQKIFDLRWKEYLTDQQQQSITDNVHIHKYLNKINLKMGENGLLLRPEIEDEDNISTNPD